jgi:hypothetical protein
MAQKCRGVPCVRRGPSVGAATEYPGYLSGYLSGYPLGAEYPLGAVIFFLSSHACGGGRNIFPIFPCVRRRRGPSVIYKKKFFGSPGYSPCVRAADYGTLLRARAYPLRPPAPRRTEPHVRAYRAPACVLRVRPYTPIARVRMMRTSLRTPYPTITRYLGMMRTSLHTPSPRVRMMRTTHRPACAHRRPISG